MQMKTEELDPSESPNEKLITRGSTKQKDSASNEGCECSPGSQGHPVPVKIPYVWQQISDSTAFQEDTNTTHQLTKYPLEESR